jgi:hypothetical protein
MNTAETNKLIAEFMEISLKDTKNRADFFDLVDSHFRITVAKIDGLCPYCHNHVQHGQNYRCYTLDVAKMKYNSSWDWLMPVVGKLSPLLLENIEDAEVEEIVHALEDDLLKADITAVYTQVVEAIETLTIKP